MESTSRYTVGEMNQDIKTAMPVLGNRSTFAVVDPSLKAANRTPNPVSAALTMMK